MLIHPTSERLIALGFTGMAKALDEQRHAPTTFDSLGFEERLGLLVDREAAERDTKRLDRPPQVCRPAPGRLCRGSRPAHPARHRSRRHGSPGRWRMDRAPREPAHHRPDWSGKKAGSPARSATGLPRRPRRRLPSGRASLRSPRHRQRRRPTRPDAQGLLRQDRPALHFSMTWGLARFLDLHPERRDMLEILRPIPDRPWLPRFVHQPISRSSTGRPPSATRHLADAILGPAASSNANRPCPSPEEKHAEARPATMKPRLTRRVEPDSMSPSFGQYCPRA